MSLFLVQAAFALADVLMGASPGEQPYRAVAFLLGRPGHRRAGASDKTARELHERSLKFADIVRTGLRAQYSLDYDPLDVVEFNSFDELLKKKPRGGAVWHDILLITHGSGELPAGFTGQIFFGKELFAVSGSGMNDLLDAINAKRTRVDAFRKGFYESAHVTLIACAGAATGPDVPVYVRELFAVRGQIKFPVKNVDFFPNGKLGTPIDPDDPQRALRELAPDEWRVVPGKD